jgi:hypothetical protein
MLQDWVNQADPNLRGDYISAQNAFLSFLREGHILRLTDLRIQNLPEQIGNHRAFQRLEQLSILGGSITSLPLSLFTKCPAMKLFVCISCSALTTIPAITDCPALEDIYFISCSALTTIPPITDCPALARISFMGCAALTTAPTITNCPALTRISFVHCRGLTGFSNELGHLSASLHTVYIKAGKPLPCFPKLLDDTSQERKTLLDKLKDWLERLSFAADKNQSFYALIVKNLELAEENEDFRILFWANVEEGCTTCGDRVTLSVLRMGMIRARMALKGQSLTEIWACLKQAWAIDILEVHAQNKANNMQNVDTIEIFLGYPIALKGRLGLSLDVNGMLFFTLSNLTEEDLNLAENDVKACWGNPEEAAFYLINQPEWIDGLKSTYPTEMAEVEDLTARRGSEDINEDEAMKLNDEIKSRLVKLSMNQLQKEMTA